MYIDYRTGFVRKSFCFIYQIDYTVDSEGEWEEPCKDGEELRSDAEDLSDSEAVDSDSDTDSFIVPHGHLSDDELNEDEQQQVRICDIWVVKTSNWLFSSRQ